MPRTLYLRDVDILRDELSVHVASDELRAATDNAREPYRTLLRGVRERLLATRSWIDASLRARETRNPDASVYVEPQEFTAALSLCERSLLETGYGAIAAGRLLDLRRRAAVFGMTLARLDVRQDASKHTEILAAVTSALGRGSYAEWDEAARIDFVVRELEGDGRLIPDGFEPPPELRDVLETFRVIAQTARRLARGVRDHDDTIRL